MTTAAADTDIARVRAIAGKHVHSEQRLRASAAATLHDQVAQTIVAARLKVSLLRRELPDHAAELESVTQRLDDALDQVRALTQMMASPVTLRDIPLDAALRWFVRDAVERRKVALKLSIAAEISADPVTPIARFGLFEVLTTIVDAASEAKAPLTIAMSSDAGQISIGVDVPRGVDIVALSERASWCDVSVEPDASAAAKVLIRVSTQTSD